MKDIIKLFFYLYIFVWSISLLVHLVTSIDHDDMAKEIKEEYDIPFTIAQTVVGHWESDSNFFPFPSEQFYVIDEETGDKVVLAKVRFGFVNIKEKNVEKYFKLSEVSNMIKENFR